MSHGNGYFCNPPRGQIEVIAGPMFSSKSEELIRRLTKCLIAKQKVQVFKPATDNRDGGAFQIDHISSRSGFNHPATVVANSKELAEAVEPDTEVIAIDEAQFFDDALPEECDKLANRGIRVMVAGLDTDFQGEPFGPLPGLLCRAEAVDKMMAVCTICGNPAAKTYRKGKHDTYIVVGDADVYEARCRRCAQKR